MAPERLSAVQRRILAWLVTEERRTRGTMTASYPDLVQALGHDKGNLSRSLANLEAKGLAKIARIPGGKAEALDLRLQGRKLAAQLSRSCKYALAFGGTGRGAKERPMFVPLTNDRGERIYVNITLVQCLMPFDATHADSYERRCRSQLSCVGGYYRVRETVEEVRALMGAGDKTP